MRRVPTLLCLSLAPVVLAACAGTTTTAGFKGEQHEVAQTVANLQVDATAAEEKKICANDLAAPLVARLGGSKRCEAAIKSQLTEVDSLTVSIQSVHTAPGGTTATAQVKSTYEGKNRVSNVSLVKEDGKWKISGLG